MNPSCDTISDKPLNDAWLELEQADFAPDAVERVLRRHADIGEQIRELLAMRQKVDEAAPDPTVSLPGRIGPFRIVRVLATGGMGIVCEAIQDGLERRVALKLIRPEKASSQAHARFKREQRVLGHLHQTNIVSIHTAGEEGGLQYFAMPLVEGATLQNVLATLRTTVAEGTTCATGKIGTVVHEIRETTSAHASTILSGEFRAGAAAAVPIQPEVQVVLSTEYMRSVAAVMADVADAMQHVHAAGILHRDLKPSNIMVDEKEQSWIIDFGLAGCRTDVPELAESQQIQLEDLPEIQTSILGTPQYMAPEQFHGDSDVRSDVWGLGVTLYELLTLRAAFRAESMTVLAQMISTGPYTAPRVLVPNLPRDLEAIVLKSLRGEPADRYQTAQDVAQELRRWLGSEPVKARPARALRRAWLWARRNRGWAAAIAAVLLAAFVLGIGGFFHQKVRAAEAEQRQRESNRELAIQRMQRIRLTPRMAGWSDDVWSHARDAAGIRRDDLLRDETAAGLVGTDAKQVKRFAFGAYAIAFSPRGDELLIGGLGDASKIWDRKTDRLAVYNKPGAGPVAFLNGATPVQLRPESPRQYVLWNLAQDSVVRDFKLPEEAAPDSLEPVSLALSQDGQWAAAALSGTTARGMVAVWNAEGELVRSFQHAVTAIALSPDGTLLAAGSHEGTVTVWAIESGEQIASFRGGRNRIYALDFARDRQQQSAESPDWLLAAGDAGGTIIIWNVDAELATSYCRGSHYSVYTVRFSPDGVTLASGGRGRTRLWDFRTGRTLVELESGDYITDIQFSPAGDQLATASAEPTVSPQVCVWDLESGRGIRALRGLNAQVSKVCFSDDATLVAALAHDWQVAVWSLASGHLKALIDAPKGEWADNAAVAISPDGGRLAISAGSEARLWDLQTGRELRSWALPPGLCDNLAFHPSGRLLLSRVETRDGEIGPYSNAHPLEHPRVLRIRDLAAEHPLTPLAEVTEFNWHVFCASVTRHGESLAVQGIKAVGSDRQSIVSVLDGITGETRWTIRLPKSVTYGFTTIDSADSALAFLTNDEGQVTLVRPDGVQIGTFERTPFALQSQANLLLTRNVRQATTPQNGYSLFDLRQPESPLVTLGIDHNGTMISPRFSPDGRLLAWGTEEGVVLVFDLPRIQERLATAGLGW